MTIMSHRFLANGLTVLGLGLAATGFLGATNISADQGAERVATVNRCGGPVLDIVDEAMLRVECEETTTTAAATTTTEATTTTTEATTTTTQPTTTTTAATTTAPSTSSPPLTLDPGATPNP